MREHMDHHPSDVDRMYSFLTMAMFTSRTQLAGHHSVHVY